MFVLGTASKLKDQIAHKFKVQHNLAGSNFFSFRKLYKNKLTYTSALAQKD